MARAAPPPELAEAHRELLQDGAGLLLGPERSRQFLALDEAARDVFAAQYLVDPAPGTDENELLAAIARRRAIAYDFADTPLDPRWRVAFLHGRPLERQAFDCGAIFRQFEVWSYPAGPSGAAERRPDGKDAVSHVLFFEPEAGVGWRLFDTFEHRKLDLFVDDVQYLMQYWEEWEGIRFFADRFDLQLCRTEGELLDEVTGVWAATRRRRDPRLLPEPLAPPADLAAWTVRALAEPAPAGRALALREVRVAFPARHNSERLVTRFVFVLDAVAPPAVAPGAEGEGARHQLELDAVLERHGKVLDRARWRFSVPPPDPGVPVVLAAELPLRAGAPVVARFRLADTAGEAALRLTRAFTVPGEPEAVPELPVPDAEVAGLAAALGEQPIAGADGLVLAPPAGEVVLGRWRAEAVVSGSRIEGVAFLLDDKPVLRVNRPPYAVELDLGDTPREHLVRAEGYDAAGELVASDEVLLNQPRGALRVRILEPRPGARAVGRTRAKASLVVPEGKKVASLGFHLDGRLVATRDRPPWEAWLDVPDEPGRLSYLTVVAALADGSTAEDVRILGAAAFGAEETVDLVELYATVTDRGGRPVMGLAEGDFEVVEDGRVQELQRFEAVEDLKLSLGLVLDASSSMNDRIEIAKQAAQGFLDSVLRPGDRVFAVAFADEPQILQAITTDAGAVADRVAGLRAYGYTALHDAVATGVYYASALEGQRAIVLLSDGDDTSSTMAFRQVLEYARRAGVAVYAVGVGIPSFELGVRRKLESLAEATGGRALFVGRAEDLAGVYEEIGRELRSRYLLAYVSDAAAGDGAFRSVEVRLRRVGLRARTVPGYYP